MKLEKVSEEYINILKRLSGEEKLKEGMELYEFAMSLSKASINNEFPSASSKEISDKLKNRIPG